jgi:hypothetical protein
MVFGIHQKKAPHESLVTMSGGALCAVLFGLA